MTGGLSVGEHGMCDTQHPTLHRHTSPSNARWALLTRFCLLIIFTYALGRQGTGGSEQRWGTRVLLHRGRRMLLREEPSLVLYTSGQLILPNGMGDEGGSHFLLPGLMPTGELRLAAKDNLQPDATACSSTCVQLEGCNVFSYCPLKDGCSNADYNYSSPYRGCELLNQALSSPATGRPIVAVGAPGFIGGAPIRLAAPEIEGYELLPGLSFWYKYDYSCNGSVAQAGSCGLNGTPVQLAEECDADPSCRVMSWYPYGRDYVNSTVTLFKGGPGAVLNLSESNYNQNSVLYMKKAPLPPLDAAEGTGGSGLSGGAVAGIVVGIFCALCLIVGGCFWVVRKRRSQQLLEEKELQSSPRRPSAEVELQASASNGSPESGQSPFQAASEAQRPGSSPAAPVAAQPPRTTHRRTDYQIPPTPANTAVTTSSASSPGHTAGGAMSGSNLASERGSGRDSGRGSSGRGGGLSTAPPPPCPAPKHPRYMEPQLDSANRAHSGDSSVSLLLSRLPDETWQSCIVDFNAIHFCRRPDGSYVELGTGAFSTVYRVLLDGVQPHAAKVLHLGDDPKAQECFLKEANILRQLRHRNIVAFNGVSVWEGRGIILMEYMENRDLMSCLGMKNKLGERVFAWHRRGKAVALDIARALHYIHSHKLTHFDCKSRNVLLDKTFTAKLADVGFARVMRATHHSMSDGRYGTFDYMAPELLMGRPCTDKIDIYSYGVLLHELVTGEYPARGCLQPLRVPEECPQEVADLQLACVDEDPAQRPTARELVEHLSRLQRTANH